MDWLGKYSAEILCKDRIIRVKTPEGKQVTHKNLTPQIQTISAIQAVNMLKQGDKGYLCYITDDNKKTKPNLEDTPIVSKYPDVFPEELPGLPP